MTAAPAEKKKKCLLPLPPVETLQVKRAHSEAEEANNGKPVKRVRSTGLLPQPDVDLESANVVSKPVVVIDLPPLPPDLQKYATRMCLLTNVSHEATREDILELFREFDPIEETLKIRHDDQGQPTGDAIVACTTLADARAAVRELNGSRFMDQNIRALLIQPS